MNARDRRKDKRRYSHLHTKIKMLDTKCRALTKELRCYDGLATVWERMKFLFTGKV